MLSQVAECRTNVLVTGATGFIGLALLNRLCALDRVRVIASVRRRSSLIPEEVRQVPVGDIDWHTDWGLADAGIDVVIHLAARAHILDEKATDPNAEFRRVNVGGTRTLAQQSVAAGVRRLVHVSSIGVNGNETVKRPFLDDDVPAPTGFYAQSKHEAECTLRESLAGTRTQYTIIRPPLVYGPDAPGNFRRLLTLIDKGYPLPLGAVRNCRSFVALSNLLDLIVTCIWHEEAANRVFLVADGDDMSTTQLLIRMGTALNKPVRLLPVPMQLLKVATWIAGGPELTQRLCGSLRLDISRTRDLLDWIPPVSVDAELRAAADRFRRAHE